MMYCIKRAVRGETELVTDYEFTSQEAAFDELRRCVHEQADDLGHSSFVQRYNMGWLWPTTSPQDYIVYWVCGVD